MRTLLILFCLTIGVHAQDFVPFPWAGGNGLLNNLIASWRFEETSGNVADASGNGRTLTENGAPGTDVGIVGNSRSFSSTDNTDYFSRATESAMALPSAFTITAWANFNARSLDPNDMTIISRGDWTGSDFSWWLFLDHGSPNDSMNFYYSTDGLFDAAKVVTFSLVGEIGSGFNFIALRWNGTTLHLSVTHNSASALETDATAAFSGTIYNGTATLRVGENEGSTTHDMGGLIDELSIWSDYKSDCQLSWLFTAKAGSFSYPSFDGASCVAP